MKFSKLIPEKIIHEMFVEISEFIRTDPKLPDQHKNYIDNRIPHISVNYSRDKISDAVMKLAGKSELCSLALYVYRQMDMIDWLPYIKAAIERNPVCFNDLSGKKPDDVYLILKGFPDESIYDENRLALPDEVWNFRRGDGIEKAILLADFIMNRDNSTFVSININNSSVIVSNEGSTWSFNSGKSFRKTISISYGKYNIK